VQESLVPVSRALCDQVNALQFAAPVFEIYNPLAYAWKPHAQYLDRYGRGTRQVVLVGMNPGPWGMAQTGVPFGDVQWVRDWLGIQDAVGTPVREHVKRPIQGFNCTRREVSGSRLWGWAHKRFGTPAGFFKQFFVWNYCPLCFMEESGRNFTPDKLKRHEQAELFRICDEALDSVIEQMQPQHIIGVGKFAADRIQSRCAGRDCVIGRIPHPSPASPSANRDWAGAAEAALREAGVCL
jgi:single-strand selective monofunctional uracil DNA glycosylase